MTIEQIKAEAKTRIGVEITDEQAGEWLKAYPDGKLTDEELDGAAGGFSLPPDPNKGYYVFDCPKCGQNTLIVITGMDFTCHSCGYNSMGTVTGDPQEALEKLREFVRKKGLM